MEERTYAKECGLRCSRLRMAQGMSQQELADKVFTTAQNISKYEKNGISNIDMIHRISDALGHDLLVDEVDAEGVVGEVGKEILWKLIEAGGHKEVEDLARQDMYGMNKSRVNQEIFKLEKIGMCVREQYVDFDEITKDMLFITAKGVITFKSHVGRSILNSKEQEAIEQVVSYEKLLGEADSYQDFVDQRETEKLIRGIKGGSCGDYRINYVHYLKSRFEEGIAEDTNRIDPYMEVLIPEQGFYHDLIYRMALHYDSERYNALLSGPVKDPGVEASMMDLEEKFIGTPSDSLIRAAEETFIKEFPKIHEVDITDEGLLEEEKSQEEIEERRQQGSILFPYWKGEEELQDNYENPGNVFLRSLQEGHTTPYPTRWYTDEEIRQFIADNLHRAESDEEKALDAVLKRINEQNPETLQYYSFPLSWEENGLADLVRDIYGLPKETTDDGSCVQGEAVKEKYYIVECTEENRKDSPWRFMARGGGMVTDLFFWYRKHFALVFTDDTLEVKEVKDFLSDKQYKLIQVDLKSIRPSRLYE